MLAAGAAALRRAASAAELDRLDVSPAEQTYHVLRVARAAEDGAPAPLSAADLDDYERRLGELISARCDRVWEGVHERRYVKSNGGRVIDLDGGAIFAEIRDIVQEVASLYHAGSQNAVLQARAGDIALAVRSAIGDLLHLVSQIPYVDPAAWSVESVVTRLEQAEKGLALYARISPYERYINAAWIAARFAAGASPLSIAAWFIGTEGAKRIGGRFFKRRAEAWAKELLEGSVGLVYLHVARIYDPQRVHRDPTGRRWSRRCASMQEFPVSTTTGRCCLTASCAHASRTSSPRWRCSGRWLATESRTAGRRRLSLRNSSRPLSAR